MTLLADVLLKQSTLGDWRYLAAGFVAYGLVALPVAFAFRFTSFGGLFFAWEAATVIMGVGIATIFYHEPFSLSRMLAIAFAVAAMALGTSR